MESPSSTRIGEIWVGRRTWASSPNRRHGRPCWPRTLDEKRRHRPPRSAAPARAARPTGTERGPDPKKKKKSFFPCGFSTSRGPFYVPLFRVIGSSFGLFFFFFFGFTLSLTKFGVPNLVLCSSLLFSSGCEMTMECPVVAAT